MNPKPTKNPKPIKIPPEVPLPAKDGIVIRRDGTNLGPYSEAQVAEMVRDGIIAPVELAWREGLAEWQPLFTLGIKGCVPPPAKQVASLPVQDASDNSYGNRFFQNLSDNSHGNQFLETLQLQNKMKSKAVAALLAILFPFIGCLYSAPIAAILCGIVGVFFASVGVNAHGDAVMFSIFSIFYVLSIFRAIAGVTRFNRRLIEKARMS